MLALERPITFTLPPELEAHEPPEARSLQRDQVRLLVTHYRDDQIQHARFDQLPEILSPGDLLVVNDSRTLPAALTATRNDGSTLALHLSTKLPGGLWVVEPRKTAVSPSEQLTLPAGGAANDAGTLHGFNPTLDRPPGSANAPAAVSGALGSAHRLPVRFWPVANRHVPDGLRQRARVSRDAISRPSVQPHRARAVGPSWSWRGPTDAPHRGRQPRIA